MKINLKPDNCGECRFGDAEGGRIKNWLLCLIKSRIYSENIVHTSNVCESGIKKDGEYEN